MNKNYIFERILLYQPFEIGKEILTPEEGYIYSFKFLNITYCQVKLRSSIKNIKIELIYNKEEFKSNTIFD